MKVTIPDKGVKFLANIIAVSEQTPNLNIKELGNNWANWVASPVTHHTIKPKEARTILIVVGILTDHGVSVSAIANKLLETFVENYSEASGGGSHE